MLPYNILNHSKWNTYDGDISKCLVICRRLVMGQSTQVRLNWWTNLFYFFKNHIFLATTRFLFCWKNKIKIYTNMNKVLIVSILIINLLRKVTTLKLKKFEKWDITCLRGLSQENILWNVLGQNNPTYWPNLHY